MSVETLDTTTDARSRNHTLKPLDHTREWLEEKGRFLKPAKGQSFNEGVIDCFRRSRHSYRRTPEEVLRSPLTSAGHAVNVNELHFVELHNLEAHMLNCANLAVQGVDEWLNSQLKPPQTHSVLLCTNTYIDGDKIESVVMVRVMRLT